MKGREEEGEGEKRGRRLCEGHGEDGRGQHAKVSRKWGCPDAGIQEEREKSR